MGLRTEYSFTLPKGYVDQAGTLHRQGTMRLATARDEIEPLRDPRISGAEDPYLTIIVLARVITELGSLGAISPAVVEGLFAADLAFLQDVYGIINFGDPADLRTLQQAVLEADAGDDADTDEYDLDGTVVNVDETVELDAVEAAPAPAGTPMPAHAGASGNVFTGGAEPALATASLRHRIEEVRSQLR